MAARMGVGEVPCILLLSADDTDILDLEEFRGLVPHENIRAAYSVCRNIGRASRRVCGGTGMRSGSAR